MKSIRWVLVWAAVGLAPPAVAQILPFGFNKVNYRQFEWKVLATDHFEIYFYPEEERLARQAAFFAERAYRKMSVELDVYPFERTPLFVYRNQPEFQQTHVIPGYIGEGVGGVTEAFKNRMVIPAVSSPRRLEEVIAHEFTHRIQFEVLYGGFLRSLKLLRSVFVPLWFAEGLAEYEAADEDPTYTRMLLRDAVVSERLRPLDQLDSFNHLDGREVSLAYKMGQSVFEFIAQRYGKDKIGPMLKEYQKPQATISQALKAVLGDDLDELSERWHQAMKEEYWFEVHGRQDPDESGRPLTAVQKGVLAWFSKPVWAPSGKQVALFADYESYTDLYLMDMTTFEMKKLLGLQFEGVVSQGHGVTWSPDGKHLAFTAARGGTHALFVYDLEAGRVVKAAGAGQFDLLSSPAFSPAGDTLAFVGMKDGASDVYVWPLGDALKGPEEQVAVAASNVTSDEADDDSPTWSPDGRALAYVSEREGHRQLVVLSLGAGGAAAPQALHGPRSSAEGAGRVVTNGAYEHLTPWWAPKGEAVYLASNREDARYNLFEYRLATGEMAQLTRVKIGVFTPRPSPDGRELLFGAYLKGSQHVYVMPEDRLRALREKPLSLKPAWAEAVALTGQAAEAPVAGTLLAGGDTLALLSAPPEARGGFSMRDAEELPVRPYRFSPSVDLVYFLFGYDSTSGFVGGGYMVGSDVLGHHQFEAVVNAFREFTSGYQLTYLYLPFRIGLGFRVFNWSNFIPLRDPLGQDLGRTGSRETGGAILASYPFDRYRRLDLALGSHLRGEEPGGTVIENGVALSYVQEGRVFYSDEPVSGTAHNVTIQRNDRFLGGTQRHTTFLTEHQFYAGFTREIVLASRFFFGSSTDTDSERFLVGGMNNLRGFAFREFSGTQTALWNTEFRFPVHPNLNVALWPFNWLLIKRIKAALFLDVGGAWDDYSTVNWGTAKVGVGAGVRIHTFVLQAAPLILRIDMGKRLDSSQSEVYYVGVGHAF